MTMTPVTMSHFFGKYVITAPIDSRLDKLCRRVKMEFPDLVMRHKRTVWYHWIAHVLICIFTLFLNRKYIGKFTTTSTNCIDWADKHHERLQTGKELDRVWECFMHELEHLRQFRTYGRFKMTLMWAIPPILFCYGRAIKIEKPGYIASMRAKWETNRAWLEHPEYRKWWIGQFTGPNYGWMWILKKQVASWFDTELTRLRAEEARNPLGE
jgi:hypothetical protein